MNSLECIISRSKVPFFKHYMGNVVIIFSRSSTGLVTGSAGTVMTEFTVEFCGGVFNLIQ